MVTENDCIKIIDFGDSKVLVEEDETQAPVLGRKRQRSSTFVGTPYYVAPEMLENNESGFYTDFWAFGNVIFEMSQGYPPFRGKNQTETYQNILSRSI